MESLQDAESLFYDDEANNDYFFEEGYSLKTNTVQSFPVVQQNGKPKGWFHEVADVFSNIINEGKISVSYFLPYVDFYMMCSAIIHEHKDANTFGLTVLIHNQKRNNSTGSRKNVVGGSIHQRRMKAGSISVRLVSSDFEADTKHGESQSLYKIEHDFHGRDFEKQFACVYKDQPIKEGVFGKVLVEHMQENGASQIIFEFNLTKSAYRTSSNHENPKLSLHKTDSDRWSCLAVKELAILLHITDHDNWKSLAKQLGFTEHEVSDLSNKGDPFERMLSGYQKRGGTPEEFIPRLYGVGRKLSIEAAKFDETEDDYRRHVMNQQLSNQSSKRCSSQILDELIEEKFEEEDSACDAATIDITQLDVPISSVLAMTPPLTPPPTPRKRKGSSSKDSIPPSKRVARCLNAGAFADSIEVTQDDTVHKECQISLSEGTLWQVASHVNRQWKSLGRHLDIPEKELLCIDLSSKESKDCCYQTLLKWREYCPEMFKFGVLYTALSDIGLQGIAAKCCVVPDLDVKLPKASQS